MTLPVLKVEIDFANGPSFSYPLILDNAAFGQLNLGVLGDAPADLVDISDQVMRCSVRRGRNRILANFEAGTATVTLNDPDSDFNPQNASGPYYGKLIPLRKIRIYAETEYLGDTVEVDLFAGYITSYDTGFYSGVYTTSTVVLQCVDGFRLLNNVSTPVDAGTPPVPVPIPGCTTAQLSGLRVNSILTFAGFPTSMREINFGNSTMQADPGGVRSVLAAIQTVEQSEFGAFFMGRSGKTLFYSRDRVAEAADVPARIYTDLTPTAVNFPYSNIDFAFDDQNILNRVTVERIGGVAQTVESQDSIDRFFVKSGQRTNLLIQTDQESQDQANTLLAARKDADLRIESITLNMNATVNELNTLVNLSSDIYNLIVAEKQMPGGSSIEKELFIQGVQHDVTPDSWNIKLFTAEPLIQAFILDSTNQGILGNTVPQNTNVLSY
jgi:hypothetical protein